MKKMDYLNSTNPVTLFDLINILKSFKMDVTKCEMNTTGYPSKSVQSTAGLNNLAFLASVGASQQDANVSYFNASASTSKAPQSSEKIVVVSDTQTLKIST
ncbi:hypothetical protein Hanom_Chr10g00903851 [Helianthus anomalus]